MKTLRNLLMLVFSLISYHAHAFFCQASFTYSISTSGSSYEIVFANNTQGIYAYEWNFGDGSFSSQQEPTHHYQAAGTYTVCLEISDNQGCRDTLCKTFSIQNTGGGCIDSNFISLSHPCPTDYEPICGCNGVTYSNSCEAKYRAGVVNWTNGACQNTSICDASFNYSVIISASGHLVFFNNSSSGSNLIFSWDFGDSAASDKRNPTHVYPASTSTSTIEVCLTVTDSVQQCTDSYCQFISLTPAGCVSAAAISPNILCPAVFEPVCGCDNNTYDNACEAHGRNGITSWTNGTCSGTAGCKARFATRSRGLLHNFENISTGLFSSCLWDFGDGITSSDCNPHHNFSQPGRYLTCLTVSDSASNCHDNFCAPITVSAANQNCPDSLLISNNPCPSDYEPVCGCNGVTYSNACIASNHYGVSCWTEGACSAANIVSCKAFFSFNTIPSPIGYEVYFINQSSGSVATNWSFGDGTVSNRIHPNHTFLVPGYYLVCLTVEDTLLNCSDTYCASIRVNAGSDCIDLTVIDQQVSCPAVIDPVCGCDGKTYVNSCEAYYQHGVTYWTKGACANGCQADYTFAVDSTGSGVVFNNASLGGFSHIFWEFGDGSNSDEVNPFHFFDVNSPQVFTICLSIFDSTSNCTDSHCQNISVTKNSETTGIASPFSGHFELKVYPNPLNQETRIEYELKFPADIEIEIFNMVGKRISLFNLNTQPARKHHYLWNAAGTPAGIYLLRFSINGEKYNHRLHVIR